MIVWPDEVRSPAPRVRIDGHGHALGALMKIFLGLKAFGGIALVVGVLQAVAPSPVGAASITVGSNYQESSNVTSSAPPAAGACNGVSYCYLNFSKVPEGRNLLVRQVSCSLSASAGNVISMYLGVRRGQNSVERFQFLNSTKYPSSQPGGTVVVNENALQIYRAGDRPEIYVGYTAAANTTGFCTISGEYVAGL